MRTKYVIADRAIRIIPLYAAGLGAASVGIAALGTAVNDTRFTGLIFGLLVLGFITSWGMRADLVRKNLLERGILVVLSGLLFGMVMMRELRYEFLPPTAFSGVDSAMASALAWLMVIYSFTLYTDRAVIFMCVPSLSLIGLVGTFGANTEMLTYFVMFVCFASFALLEQNSLSAGRQPAATPDISYRIGLSAGIVVVALSVGLIAGHVLLRSVGDKVTIFFVGAGRVTGMELQVAGDFMPVCAGPVTLSNVEVLTVKSPEPLLWRGQVFDTYTGRGWTNTDWGPVLQPLARTLPDSLSFGHPRTFQGYSIKWDEQRFGARGRVKYVQQTFRTRNASMAMLFGAAEPEFVAFHTPRQIVYSGGALRARRPYGPGEPYTVLSAVCTVRPEALMLAGEDYPEFILGRYLAVPPACWQIERLTQQVVKEKSNAYDKAVAIKRFLESQYVYDTTAPGAPQNEDAVSYFLLKSKRGYCDAFASAMAIMCRQAGIPARVVTGFATGEYDPDDKLYHVRQRDRHAWTEVYFPGYGWVTFDLSPQRAQEGFLTGLQRVIKAAYRAIARDLPGAVAVLLFVSVVIYSIKVGLSSRSLKRTRWGSGLAYNISRAALNYRTMCDLLARLGHPRSPSTTPLEYVAQVSGIFSPELETAPKVIEAVTQDFLEARYALRELPDARIDTTTRLLEEFARSIRRLSRVQRRAIRQKQNGNAR